MKLHGVTFRVTKIYEADELAMVEFDDGQIIGVPYTPGEPFSSMYAQIEQWLKTGYSDSVVGFQLKPVTQADVL